MDASDRKELRVILDNINALNDEWFDTFPTDEGQTSIHDLLECEIIKADKILAKPPRNCDVGTADKQSKMFDTFCHGRNCEDCPIHYIPGDCYCTLAWAQMPYEKGGEA